MATREEKQNGKAQSTKSAAEDNLDPLPDMFPTLGSTLDNLDKALTSPFNRIYLGVLEIPLTVVGTWFGIPITSMALCPLVLGVLESRSIHLTVLTFGLFVVALIAYFVKLAKGKQDDFYAVPKVILFLALIGAQVATHVSHLYNLGDPNPSSKSAWYLISYVSIGCSS